jgi:predicted transcriptional regulator
MKIVENIINECGISKVRVAKYLGVSRQMLYNYFAMDFKDVPKEKMNKIFKLFGVEGEEELKNLKVDDKLSHQIEEKLSAEIIDI